MAQANVTMAPALDIELSSDGWDELFDDEAFRTSLAVSAVFLMIFGFIACARCRYHYYRGLDAQIEADMIRAMRAETARGVPLPMGTGTKDVSIELATLHSNALSREESVDGESVDSDSLEEISIEDGGFEAPPAAPVAQRLPKPVNPENGSSARKSARKSPRRKSKHTDERPVVYTDEPDEDQRTGTASYDSDVMYLGDETFQDY